MSNYHCFSQKGEGDLPMVDEIYSIIESGFEPILFLDSCVCLDIIKVIDYPKKATGVDITKVISLKEHISKYPIKISPFFGLMELCIRNDEIDKAKLNDFKNRIDFFEQIPLKRFKRFKYDFTRDYFVFKDVLENFPATYPAISELIKNNYCALLKMRSLAKAGLTRQSAVSSITSFLDWMVNELDLGMAFEYKLALNIFGGKSEFRKMIALDSSGKDIKKILIATSWDAFNARFTSNSFLTSKLLGRSIYPFFLTGDSNLAKIFERFSLTFIKDGGETMMTSFLHNSEFNFPHYDQSFLEVQNSRILNLFIERRNKVYRFDLARVNRIIENLEKENDFPGTKE